MSRPTTGASAAKILRSTRFQAPSEPLPLPRRLAVHNQVVHRVRAFLQARGFVEVPVPELTAATGSCEVVDSMFSLDYFGNLAFPRQTGQLFLEELIAGDFAKVYCEGESLRKEWKVDERHLTEFKLVEIEERDLDLAGLMDLQEELIKDVARHLDADLLGGPNVTRLDRMIQREHPRLTYREALAILNRLGWSMPFGEDFHRDAEATLVRHCGNLPVHVTHFPESLKFFNMKLGRDDPRVVECVDYILPCAGETFGGSVREHDPEILSRRLYEGTMYGHLMTRAREFAAARATTPAPDGKKRDAEELAASYQQAIENSFSSYLRLFRDREIHRAGFGLGVARLLQYVMGLDSIKDAVIFPLDRASFGTHGAAGDGLRSEVGIA
jgi:asparaginyl-tRNA synthetase